ncbi:MAG: hypothetical protein GEU28_08555 [Dehalococcoidia bacterium]|nr:hypothetical protein [Dehalococcoidia bacterium]
MFRMTVHSRAALPWLPLHSVHLGHRPPRPTLWAGIVTLHRQLPIGLQRKAAARQTDRAAREEQLSTTDSPGEIRSERRGAVLLLTIAREHKRNALSREMVAHLVSLVTDAAADNSVVAVVLTGQGSQSFCAGADMNEQREDPATSMTLPVVEAITRFPKPFIAAINGFAHGGGAWIASACDLRFGSPGAEFRFPGASYGMAIGAAHLPRIVGSAFAREIIFTAKRVSSEEALRVGLLNGVFGSDALLAETLDLAGAVAVNSLPALMGSKAVIDATMPIEEALALEAAVNSELRSSVDTASRFGRAASRVLGAG